MAPRLSKASSPALKFKAEPTRPNKPVHLKSLSGMLAQASAPLYDSLVNAVERGVHQFHTPGHKGGGFTCDEIRKLVGAEGLKLDLPALTDTDNTFHPHGALKEAHELAADLFGAKETFYLSAGSTIGIATAMLAAVSPGRTIMLARNVHRSVIAALVLSGAKPHFLPHRSYADCGVLGFTAKELEAALQKEPVPAAILITRPTYYGMCSELRDVIKVCHARKITVIVDEAHGAHFKFLPEGGPIPALDLGADLVVQSCHKTLGTLVGSAQLHVGKKSLVAPSSIRDALNLLQTTSPSFLILASLDAMRRHLALNGDDLFASAVAHCNQLRDEINSIKGISVFNPDEAAHCAGYTIDPLRLLVNVAGTGWSGYQVEDYMGPNFKFEDEMADWENIVLILGPNEDNAACRRLIEGLRYVSSTQAANRKRVDPNTLKYPQSGQMDMTPRDAALGPKEMVSARDAVGRISAEMVMFYPPGIPLLIPGERIEAATVEACRGLLEAGAHAYASDGTLSKFRVSVT